MTTNHVRNGFGDVIRRNSPDTGISDYEYSALGKVTKIDITVTVHSIDLNRCFCGS